jgi:general secretion pathway protein H
MKGRASRHFALRPLSASSVRGFTLMEVLVVIIVIGVIIAAATLSMGVLGRDREAEDQMRRVWAVLVQAREECELQGIDTGLFISSDSYEFLRFDTFENRWIPIANDQLFRPRTLPEGLRFRLSLESKQIVLKPDAVNREDKTEDQKWPPQILVLSSGDIQPFELQVERDGEPALWRVDAQPDGDLRLERRNETQEWDVISQTREVEEDNVRSRLGDKASDRS